MKRKRSKPSNVGKTKLPQLTLTYRLVWTGSALAKVQCGSAAASLLVSYMTDALGDLAESTCRLIEDSPQCEVFHEDGRQTIESHCETIRWTSEPGLWEWRLTIVDPCSVRVSLHTSDNDEIPADHKPLFELEMSAEHWCELVLAVLEKVLSTQGLSGYRETWVSHEFPVGSYLKLLSYRESMFRLGRNYLHPNATRRTRLADDLQVLRKLARSRR